MARRSWPGRSEGACLRHVTERGRTHGRRDAGWTGRDCARSSYHELHLSGTCTNSGLDLPGSAPNLSAIRKPRIGVDMENPENTTPEQETEARYDHPTLSDYGTLVDLTAAAGTCPQRHPAWAFEHVLSRRRGAASGS